MPVLAAGSLKFTFQSDGALEVRLEGGEGHWTSCWCLSGKPSAPAMSP